MLQVRPPSLEASQCWRTLPSAAGVQVMVGYMRRFAPAFLAAVEEVKRLTQINYVRVRDIIGEA